MNKQMLDAYFADKGWTIDIFLKHVEFLFTELKTYEIKVDVAHNILYIRRTTPLGAVVLALKCYVHCSSGSKAYLTITDSRGNALKSFYPECTPRDILTFILTEIDKQKQDDPHDCSHLNLFQSSW